MAFGLLMFDLDGTLVETAPEIADALDASLGALALPKAGQERVEAWIGGGTRELLVKALAWATAMQADEARADARLGEMARTYDIGYRRRCGKRSRPFAHVKETLQALLARGIPMAVVTNKELHFTQALLDAHGLTHFFGRVIDGDNVPAKKPDPAGIKLCLTHFGVPASRALMVGDSATDVAAARNAGVAVWLVRGGYNGGAPIAASSPDRIVEDLRALLE